jgi:hypothetical protein
MNKVDLSTAIQGQKLKSKHGMILTYSRPLENNYYDHEVVYPDGSLGTRTNDGYVYRNEKSRMVEDHDIVEILPTDSSEVSLDIPITSISSFL